MEEYVVNVVTTVTRCKEKSTSEVTAIPSTDAGVAPRDGDDDAVVDVIPPCLLQDQMKTVCEFNTYGQQQREEFEVVDTDSELSFCTCSSDVSEVKVELLQTDAARMCANSMEQSVPSHKEPPISELESVPETENALGSEILYEFSIAECSHRPEASILEDACTFEEETTAPEIPELTLENLAEPSEIDVCLETAELRDKVVTESVDQSVETAEESVSDGVEEIPVAEQVEGCEILSEVVEAELREKPIAESFEQLVETAEESLSDGAEEMPAAEQVEGCEILSEVVEAELKQMLTSETAVQHWSLDSDDVDDFFEMAYEDKLTPEEIQQETVALENKTQPVSSSSDQLLPDVFDGATEDISALDMENVVTPSEIPSDTVLLDSKWLESSYTSGQELTVTDEEDQVKEMEQESEEVGVSPDEMSSEFVVAEASGLKPTNTLQQESAAEEEHLTEDLSERETMTAVCDEVKSEVLEPSSMSVALQHSVSDVVTEVNELDQYTDIAAEDEEQVVEPEEISSSLVTTSLVPKAEYLTVELVDELSSDGAADGEPGEEAEVLSEGTTVDSPLVSDETVKAQMQSYSSEQMSEIQEDSLGDNVDELPGDSIEGEVMENLTAEAGSLRDLPQSCVAVVKEEHLVEEYSDLPSDVTSTSFVSGADTVSDDLSFLPITTVSSAAFESTSSLPKVEQRTPERQLTISDEDACGEVESGVVAAEPVVGDVVVDLETAQTADEPEIYEMFIEEELTVEEKIITESIVTTVRSVETVERRNEGITVEGIRCCGVCMSDPWHVGLRLL